MGYNEVLLIRIVCNPELRTLYAFSTPDVTVTAPSELGFRFLLFKHGFRNHSTLNLSCWSLGHIAGQENLRSLSLRFI